MNIIIMKNNIIISGMLLLSLSAIANDNMSFHGTLNEPPPCTINSGNEVDVSFGKVGVNKVDGQNYIQTLNYQITCEDNLIGWALNLSWTGNTTDFDSAAVQTDVNDLGVRLLQSGNAFLEGSSIPVSNQNSPPLLQVVPVKRGGATLTEGHFSATATLQVEYQ
jgi:type 1 fimbria pilin